MDPSRSKDIEKFVPYPKKIKMKPHIYDTKINVIKSVNICRIFSRYKINKKF